MLENDLVESKNEIAKKFAELEVANKHRACRRGN